MQPSGDRRPTKATMIAAKPYPGEIVGVSCPSGPEASMPPASPESAPQMMSDAQMSFPGW